MAEKEIKDINYLRLVLDKLKPLLGLFLLCLILSVLSSNFFTFTNLFNVLRQTSIIAIPAIGMTFIILTGGIDLSVGSVAAFVGVIVSLMLKKEVNIALVLLAGLGLGSLIGAATGLVITKQRVPPFIATLSTMAIFRGATMVITEGRPVTGLGDAFAFLGTGYLGPIPFPVFLWMVLFILGWFILSRTRLGEYIYAVGGNEEAAYLSGIFVDRVKTFAYISSGFLSALAGIIITSRLDSAQPVAGQGMEMDAIAAVILGGTSLSGGKGHLYGTVIGALIIGVLNNGLNLLGISSFYQQLVKGAVILIAVLLDSKRK